MIRSMKSEFGLLNKTSFFTAEQTLMVENVGPLNLIVQITESKIGLFRDCNFFHCFDFKGLVIALTKPKI